MFADSKLSANMYDIYYCCVYSEKLLNTYEKLVHLVGFIIRIVLNLVYDEVSFLFYLSAHLEYIGNYYTFVLPCHPAVNSCNQKTKIIPYSHTQEHSVCVIRSQLRSGKSQLNRIPYERGNSTRKK